VLSIERVLIIAKNGQKKESKLKEQAGDEARRK